MSVTVTGRPSDVSAVLDEKVEAPVGRIVPGVSEKKFAVTVPVTELVTTNGTDLGVWDGVSSDLLDQQDLVEVGEAIQKGSIAVVVIFENRWLLGLTDEWRREGARIVADGGLDAEAVLAALDATERP